MSATALEILHVAKAISEGAILVDDFLELASRDEPTEEEANEIIQQGILDLERLRDND